MLRDPLWTLAGPFLLRVNRVTSAAASQWLDPPQRGDKVQFLLPMSAQRSPVSRGMCSQNADQLRSKFSTKVAEDQ